MNEIWWAEKRIKTKKKKQFARGKGTIKTRRKKIKSTNKLYKTQANL